MPLTSREEHVVGAIAKGLTNAEIAAELFISLSTVTIHVSSLMDKIGVGNRVQLVI